MRKMKLICSVLAISLILTSCAAKNRNQETASNTDNKSKVESVVEEAKPSTDTKEQEVKPEIPKEEPKQSETKTAPQTQNETKKTNTNAVAKVETKANSTATTPKAATTAPTSNSTNNSVVAQPSSKPTSQVTSTPVEQPKVETPSTPVTQPVVPSAPTKKRSVYEFSGIDENKVIKGSPKFNIQYSNLNPKVLENITFKISSLPYGSAYIYTVQEYNDNFLGGSNGQWIEDSNGKKTDTYHDLVVIQDWPLESNQVKSYIFIKFFDGPIYEYDSILSIAK